MTKPQIDKLAEYFAYLFDRWQDEREYEDFADYRKALQTRVEKDGATVKTFTQRPFRADIIAGAERLTFKADARSVTVHSMKDARA